MSDPHQQTVRREKSFFMAMPLYDVERFRLPTVEIASRHSLRVSHRIWWIAIIDPAFSSGLES